MDCKKCNVEMISSKALTNTPRAGIPDFPGMGVSSRGQTISMDGPAVMVKVDKCPECGFSKSH